MWCDWHGRQEVETVWIIPSLTAEEAEARRLVEHRERPAFPAASILLLVAVLNAFDTENAPQGMGSAAQKGRPVPLRFVFLFAAQDEVVNHCLAGGWIRQHLEFLRIPPALPPRLAWAILEAP